MTWQQALVILGGCFLANAALNGLVAGMKQMGNRSKRRPRAERLPRYQYRNYVLIILVSFLTVCVLTGALLGSVYMTWGRR